MKKRILAILLILLLIPCSTFAHSGKTDSRGGHRDNNNVSGLGSYHYHHGYSAHLHPNGVCPYDYSNDTGSDSTSAPNSALAQLAKIQNENDKDKQIRNLETRVEELLDYLDDVEKAEVDNAKKADFWRWSCYYSLGGCAVLLAGCIALFVKGKRNK